MGATETAEAPARRQRERAIRWKESLVAKTAYSYATGACVLLAVVFQRGGDPFGRGSKGTSHNAKFLVRLQSAYEPNDQTDNH